VGSDGMLGVTKFMTLDMLKTYEARKTDCKSEYIQKRRVKVA